VERRKRGRSVRFWTATIPGLLTLTLTIGITILATAEDTIETFQNSAGSPQDITAPDNRSIRCPTPANPHNLRFQCVGRPFDAVKETLTKDWTGYRTELAELGITSIHSYTAINGQSGRRPEPGIHLCRNARSLAYVGSPQAPRYTGPLLQRRGCLLIRPENISVMCSTHRARSPGKETSICSKCTCSNNFLMVLLPSPSAVWPLVALLPRCPCSTIISMRASTQFPAP
jgi:hypothetical protein